MTRTDPAARQFPFTLVMRLCFAAISLVALYSLMRTVYDYSNGLSALMYGLGQTSLYYTHWANGVVVVYYALAAAGWLPPRNARLLGHVLVIFAVLVLHYWLLQGLGNFLESPLRSKIVHGGLPLAILAHWLLLADKHTLRWRDAIWWTAGPLLYTIYALARGAMTGEYAYDVGNVDRLGYGQVLAIIGLTIVFVVLLGAVLVFTRKLFPPRLTRQIDGDGAVPLPAHH